MVPQEDDGEQFEENIMRLTSQWREQQAEARQLDAAGLAPKATLDSKVFRPKPKVVLACPLASKRSV